MSGNDYLYNELLEYCSGDLEEVRKTLDYFEARLQSDLDVELEKDSTQDEDDEKEGDRYDLD
jgi:hypothetical protein